MTVKRVRGLVKAGRLAGSPLQWARLSPASQSRESLVVAEVVMQYTSHKYILLHQHPGVTTNRCKVPVDPSPPPPPPPERLV